ncbi:MAG: NADH-quinone oxidoreductase subunit C [Candidatus Riflebacteria bacterium]|nr:NADH-quinone oxidoreductase subunit C [Candidatus Riflebacteria bacterium]
MTDQFSGSIEVLPAFRNECSWKINPDKFIGLVTSLRNHAEFPFEVLFDVTAVDKTPVNGTIEVVYHLFSHKINGFIRLKVAVSSETPILPTISHIWNSANWLEREVYDLFGVKFSDHPDLRRLMMPDEYEGFPLLKAHPLCPQGDCNDF